MLSWFERLIIGFFLLLGWFGAFKAFGQTGAILFPLIAVPVYLFITGGPKLTAHECHWCYQVIPPGQGFEHIKGRWYCNDTCLFKERQAHIESSGKE